MSNFLFTKYSIVAGTPVVTIDQLYITPTFLNYLGVVLLLFGAFYLIMIMSILKERILKKENILNIPFYLIIYLMIYPFILVDSIWHWVFGKKSWR